MFSLQDLCLNEIEESGADTRDLKNLEIGLPSRMYSRHPILEIYIVTRLASTPAVLAKRVTIEYTAI